MTEKQENSQASALEFDLSSLIDRKQAAPNSSSSVRILMEQMANLEKRQVFYTTMPACNSEV